MDGSDIRYYHFDELGSARLLTDGTGTITDRYVYDAYGSTLSHTGTTDQPYQYVGEKGYHTHYQDPEFSLMQLGVRFYDPQVGRFEQRDPLRYEGRVDLYAYSGDNPLSWIDPSGLSEYCPDQKSKKCVELRKGLGTRAKTLTEHAKNKHLHPAMCKKALDMLSDYLLDFCWGPPDTAPSSNFCKLVNVFRMYCRGKKWPKDPNTPFDDWIIEPFYKECKGK